MFASPQRESSLLGGCAAMVMLAVSAAITFATVVNAIEPGQQQTIEMTGRYDPADIGSRQHSILVKSNGQSVLLQHFVDTLDDEAPPAESPTSGR